MLCRIDVCIHALHQLYVIVIFLQKTSAYSGLILFADQLVIQDIVYTCKFSQETNDIQTFRKYQIEKYRLLFVPCVRSDWLRL